MVESALRKHSATLPPVASTVRGVPADPRGRRRRRLLWLLAVLLVAAPWWNIPRDQADSAGMMAHLHAFFVDADLLYDDEYARLGMSPLFAFVTDEGRVSNHWPSGATWLQAPGWGLGALSAQLAAHLGIGRPDSTGVVALLGLRAWAILVLAGMSWTIARTITLAQPDPTSRGAHLAGLWVSLAFVFATPFWHYASEDPLRPHLWGAAVVLGLVALWMRPTLGQPHERIVAMAALAGLATYVRPQLAPVLLLVASELVEGSIRERLARLALALGVFAIFPLVHLRLQVWMYGEQLGQYAGESSYHVIAFLTSTHHGVFTWCPILLLAVLAVVRSVALRERGAWIVLVILATQVWADAGMREIEPRSVLGTRTWSGGLAFGPRKLVDVLPILLPAVASLVAAVRSRGMVMALGVLALALAIPTLLLHASAWLDPAATTGDVMGTSEYVAALARPLDPSAWSAAYTPRALPWMVPLVVSALVALPLGGAGLAGARWLRARRPRVDGLSLAIPLVIFTALAMHGWLAALMVRSEISLEGDPERMLRAAAVMTPAHYGTVREIPKHHALLRERLGPGAAPPVRD